MTHANALQTPLSQQALSFILAITVTASLLAGMLGLAADDQAALMARQAASGGQAAAALLAPAHG